MNKNIITKLVFGLTLIPLYYIVGKKSIFLYVLSLSLFNIFSTCFLNFSLKESFKNIKSTMLRNKIYKTTVLITSIISLIFLIFSIIVSDLSTKFLNISDSFITFLIMGISIFTESFTKINIEYLSAINYQKTSSKLLTLYHYMDDLFLLIIALITFRFTNLEENISCGLLYFSKIISAIIINSIIFYLLKNKKVSEINDNNNEKINLKKEITGIIKANNLNTLTIIINNVYYYISIIILYLVLSTRYQNLIKDTREVITFIYFYAINLISIFVELVLNGTKKQSKTSILNKIYDTFDNFLSISIIFSIISPLVCTVLFNNKEMSIYLMMTNFMGIFLALYSITFKYITSYKLGIFSLFTGLVTKIIFMVPLIDSFYRMGYNLLYGDIVSNIIAFFVPVIINYLYLKNKESEIKLFEKILKSLTENLFLCIILVIIQFIIPINTNSYFKSLCLIFVYTFISIMYLKTNKRRKR